MALVSVQCPDRTSADQAVQALLDEGFAAQRIRVRASGDAAYPSGPAVPVRKPRRPGRVALLGGILGLVGGLVGGGRALIGRSRPSDILIMLTYALLGTLIGACVGSIVGFVRWRTRPGGPVWIPFDPPLTVEVDADPARVQRAKAALHRDV